MVHTRCLSEEISLKETDHKFTHHKQTFMECLCTGAGDTFTILKKPVPVWKTSSIYTTNNIRHHMLHAKEKGQKVPEESNAQKCIQSHIYGHKYPKQNLRKRCVISANRTGQALSIYTNTSSHPHKQKSLPLSGYENLGKLIAISLNLQFPDPVTVDHSSHAQSCCESKMYKCHLNPCKALTWCLVHGSCFQEILALMELIDIKLTSPLLAQLFILVSFDLLSSSALQLAWEPLFYTFQK